jgi:hypothetical protein
MSSARYLSGAAGAVALAAGTHQALRGVRGTAGVDPAAGSSPETWMRNVDSELRFYATWYAAAGTTALADAVRGRPPSTGAVWLTSGLLRLRGARRQRPARGFVALGVVEVGVGAVLLADQARRKRLARRTT